MHHSLHPILLVIREILKTIYFNLFLLKMRKLKLSQVEPCPGLITWLAGTVLFFSTSSGSCAKFISFLHMSENEIIFKNSHRYIRTELT